MNKLNCWEYWNCGREKGGSKVSELGECPVVSESDCNGLNNGKDAGRICWAVTGTFCGSKVQGIFAEKSDTCMACEFFKKVEQEQGRGNFVMLKPGQVYQEAI